MRCKALIFDLDNTIYPVHAIAGELFRDLFQLLDESGEAREHLDDLKEAVTRKPFQWVAKRYGLSEELTQQSLRLLRTLTVEGPIEHFADYAATRNLSQEKFLVTAGFTILQQSKIRKLGIEGDFREIYIVDPESSTKTKKDIFQEIMQKHRLLSSEVLVVGDDPDSEILAAQELGIKAVLYRKNDRHHATTDLLVISDFNELPSLLESF